jgi:hypothetical protein
VWDGELAEATFQTLASVCTSLQKLRHIRIVVSDQMVAIFQQMQQRYGSGAVTRPNDSKPQNQPQNIWPAVDTTGSKVKIGLFGENNSCLDKVQSALAKGISEACKTQQIENEYVSKLSKKQRNKLSTKAREHDVTIKLGEEPHFLVIQGDPEDVDVIAIDIGEEIKNRIKKVNDNEEAKMLCKTIRWQYESCGDAKYFDRKFNAVIEKAKINNESQATVRIKGENFLIDLNNSTGIGLVTENTISVTRTAVEGKLVINNSHSRYEWSAIWAEIK